MITSASNTYPSVPKPPDLDKTGDCISNHLQSAGYGLIGGYISCAAALSSQALFKGGLIANYMATPLTCCMGSCGFVTSYYLANQFLTERDIRDAIGKYHRSLYCHTIKMQDITARKLLANSQQGSRQLAVSAADSPDAGASPEGAKQSMSDSVVMMQPQPGRFAARQQSATQHEVVVVQPDTGCGFTPTESEIEQYQLTSPVEQKLLDSTDSQ